MPSGACGSVRPLVTRGGALLRTAGLAAVVLAAAAAPAANASADSAAAPRVELRGTVSPLVAQGLAHVVGTPSAAKQVQAVVAFKPRNAILLHWLAERSTGRPGMSNAEIQRLFAPRPATVAAVRSYLSANGLSVVDSTDMSLVVSGTAAAADQAFGVGLRTIHRRARDHAIRRRRGTSGCPRGSRRSCSRWPGSTTSLKLHPHYQIAKHVRPSPAAQGAGRAARRDRLQRRRTTQADPRTGRLPAGRPRATVYGHDADASHDGTGQIDRVRRVLELQPPGLDRTSGAASPASRGTLANDHKVERRPDRPRRPGRGQPRHRGRHGRGAATPAGSVYRRAEQPGAPADDAQQDARRRRRRRVGQLGPVRAASCPVKLTRGREHGARAARRGRRLVLRRLGRRRRRRLPRGQPGREVPRDRRPVGPAVRDRRGRHEPQDAPHGGRVEKAWKGSGGGISINWPQARLPARRTARPNVPGGVLRRAARLSAA